MMKGKCNMIRENEPLTPSPSDQVRVLFICWGSIRRNLERPRDFGTLRDVQKRIQTTFRPFKTGNLQFEF